MRRVLVVDDDDNWRFVVARALKQATGYEVAGEAADGIDAIERARELQPDVILLDLKMPRMGGEEALPLILREAPSACIVVVSGMEAALHEARLREKGAAGYLEKDVGTLRDLGGGLDDILRPLSCGDAQP